MRLTYARGFSMHRDYQNFILDMVIWFFKVPALVW